MSALSNLYAAADDIRTLLMPFAFFLCVLGIGEMGWRAGSDARAVLGTLLRTIVVVALIAGYPSAMKTGQQAFIDMRSSFTTAREAKFVQLLSSRIQNQPSDSWTNLGKIVPAAIGYFFQGIGRFMLILLRFFQEFAIAGLIAVSPLLIGFLFFSYTQSLGIQLGVTSLTVLLWHVAICLVDIVIQAISDTLFMPITANNLVQVGANLIVVNNWLMFPFIMAFASFLTVFFYPLRSVRRVRSHEGSQRNDGDPASRDTGSDADRGSDRGRWAHSRGSGGHLWRFRRRAGRHRGNEDSRRRCYRRGPDCQRSRGRQRLCAGHARFGSRQLRPSRAAAACACHGRRTF
jgi:hypothetical protein